MNMNLYPININSTHLRNSVKPDSSNQYFFNAQPPKDDFVLKQLRFSGARNNRLLRACKTVDLEKMRTALEAGAHPDAADEKNGEKRAAHLVIESNSDQIPEALQLLADYGADFNKTSEHDHTPGLLLTKNKSITPQTLHKSLQILADNDADFNIASVRCCNRGGIPLLSLCSNPSLTLEALQILANNNTDFTVKQYKSNQNAAHHIAANRAAQNALGAETFQKIIKLLVDKGVDLNAEDFDGVSPNHSLISASHEIRQAFIDNGLDFKKASGSSHGSWAPPHWLSFEIGKAYKNEHHYYQKTPEEVINDGIDSIQSFLRHGVNFNMKTKGGSTAVNFLPKPLKPIANLSPDLIQAIKDKDVAKTVGLLRKEDIKLPAQGDPTQPLEARILLPKIRTAITTILGKDAAPAFIREVLVQSFLSDAEKLRDRVLQNEVTGQTNYASLEDELEGNPDKKRTPRDIAQEDVSLAISTALTRQATVKKIENAYQDYLPRKYERKYRQEEWQKKHPILHKANTVLKKITHKIKNLKPKKSIQLSWRNKKQ